jgi:hypothetical protein
MSKAEDKLENNRLKYIEYTFKRHGIEPDSIEGQLIYYAYGHGYHQAEKDLELTCEDIGWIIVEAALHYSEDSEAEHICQEILKRFKERKEK